MCFDASGAINIRESFMMSGFFILMPNLTIPSLVVSICYRLHENQEQRGFMTKESRTLNMVLFSISVINFFHQERGILYYCNCMDMMPSLLFTPTNCNYVPRRDEVSPSHTTVQIYKSCHPRRRQDSFSGCI